MSSSDQDITDLATGNLGGSDLPSLDQYDFLNEAQVETPLITEDIDLSKANPFEVMMRVANKHVNPSWLDTPPPSFKAIVLRVENDGSDSDGAEADGWLGAFKSLMDKFPALPMPTPKPRIKVYIPKLDSDMVMVECYGNRGVPGVEHNIINMYQTAVCADEDLASLGVPQPGSIVEVQFENLKNRSGLTYTKIVQQSIVGENVTCPGPIAGFENQGGVLAAGAPAGVDLNGYSGQGIPSEILISKGLYRDGINGPPVAGDVECYIVLPPESRQSMLGWYGRGVAPGGVRLQRACDELKAFVNARLGEGSCDIGNLGIMRDLYATFQPSSPGSPTRVSTSKHSVGMAQDIQFYSKALEAAGQVAPEVSKSDGSAAMLLRDQPGWSVVSPSVYNTIVNDEPYIRAINDFFELPENADLVWGGHFGGNNATFGRKSYDWVRMGSAGELKSIRIDEIHHIEIRDGAEYWAQYMEPLTPYFDAAGLPTPMQQSDLSQTLPAFYAAVATGNMVPLGETDLPAVAMAEEEAEETV
jgi:hypothetical protein